MRMNSAGKMVVRTNKTAPMKIAPIKNTKEIGGPLPVIKLPPLNTAIPVIQYINALVVKKRNIALELQGVDTTIYEVIAFFNNDKSASVIYANYKPINSVDWRILGKYLKKIPYNTDFNLDMCDSVYEEIY